MPRRFSRAVVALVAALCVAPLAHAQSEDDLLPVEQAFKLTAKIAEPGKIALHWDIAPDYYLYRTRIKAKTAQAGATLSDLDLPAGIKKHDEFLGDVEVYHKVIDATLPYTITDPATKTLALTITVQGCHEVDPKICYPPHPTPLTLDLPAASPVGAAPAASSSSNATKEKIAADAAPTTNDAENAAPSSLASKLGEAVQSEPLPPEQAFVFEAIAASPTGVLARWTMPKGYYLYRDKSSVTLTGGDGVALGAPQWPKGVDHTDEHFGTVVVYFDQVELPIALAREKGAAQTIKLDAEYQGCQENGICYPVMTKTVSIEMPAATADELVAAKAAAGAAPAASSSPERDVAAAGKIAAGAAPTMAASAGEQSEEQALAANLSSNRGLALLSFFGFG